MSSNDSVYFGPSSRRGYCVVMWKRAWFLNPLSSAPHLTKILRLEFLSCVSTVPQIKLTLPVPIPDEKRILT